MKQRLQKEIRRHAALLVSEGKRGAVFQVEVSRRCRVEAFAKLCLALRRGMLKPSATKVLAGSAEPLLQEGTSRSASTFWDAGGGHVRLAAELPSRK